MGVIGRIDERPDFRGVEDRIFHNWIVPALAVQQPPPGILHQVILFIERKEARSHRPWLREFLYAAELRY